MCHSVVYTLLIAFYCACVVQHDRLWLSAGSLRVPQHLIQLPYYDKVLHKNAEVFSATAS